MAMTARCGLQLQILPVTDECLTTSTRSAGLDFAVLVKNSFSVFSGVLELFRNGQFLLFLVVAGFSIVLPILKIGVLFALMSRRAQQSEKLGNYLHLMHEYGRWAMLDVMVVAILIVAVKLGAIVTVEIHYGLFVFGAAVLLIMLLTRSVVRLTRKNGE